MDSNAHDAYEQFSDASTTPIWDLMIGLATVATVLGGGLAGVYAVGYLSVGRASLAWPPLGTLAVLVALNLALRAGRTSARHRG
jgi:energy-converting hydrogenase Eha subunit C